MGENVVKLLGYDNRVLRINYKKSMNKGIVWALE